MASSSAVLELPELLELILLHLPPRDIVRCQRVDKFWRDVVRQSIHLQRKAFLEPMRVHEEWTALLISSVRSRRLRPDRFWNDRSVILQAVPPDQFDARGSSPKVMVSQLNPAFQPLFKTPSTCGHAVCDVLRVTERGGHWKLDEEARETLLRLASVTACSLLDMFITQPPIQMLEVRAIVQAPEEMHRPINEAVHNTAGIRGRDITNALERIARPSHTIHAALVLLQPGHLVVSDDTQRDKLEQGVRNFVRLENALGRVNALNVEMEHSRKAQYLSQLLRGDTLDKIVAFGKVGEVVQHGVALDPLLEAFDEQLG